MADLSDQTVEANQKERARSAASVSVSKLLESSITLQIVFCLVSPR